MPQFPVAPNHSIVVGTASGISYMEFIAASGSAILPGDLVQFNNPPADCTVKEGQDNSEEVIGVAEVHPTWIQATGTIKPGDLATAYVAGTPVLILRKAFTVMLRVAASQEIQCGEFVQPAPSGEVKAYECGTDNDCQRIAQSLQTLAQDTTAFQWGVFALERLG